MFGFLQLDIMENRNIKLQLLRNVNFIKKALSGSAKRTDSSKALKVAEGGNKKSTVMTGENVRVNDELFTMAKEVFDSDEWTQVGYELNKKRFLL